MSRAPAFEAMVTKKVREVIPDVREIDVRETFEQLFGLLFQKDSFDDTEVDQILRPFRISNTVANNGYARTALTSGLVDTFISAVTVDQSAQHTDDARLWNATLPREVLLKVECLKHFTYLAVISSPRLKFIEHRGSEIITQIFQSLTKDEGHELLPADCGIQFRRFKNAKKDGLALRVVCDFIARMTDKYAIDFHRRLFGDAESLYRPA